MYVQILIVCKLLYSFMFFLLTYLPNREWLDSPPYNQKIYYMDLDNEETRDIKTYTCSIITYSFGIVVWNKLDIK